MVKGLGWRESNQHERWGATPICWTWNWFVLWHGEMIYNWNHLKSVHMDLYIYECTFILCGSMMVLASIHTAYVDECTKPRVPSSCSESRLVDSNRPTIRELYLVTGGSPQRIPTLRYFAGAVAPLIFFKDRTWAFLASGKGDVGDVGDVVISSTCFFRCFPSSSTVGGPFQYESGL